MYGPPGCGKTHLARATAGEIKAGFIAVGINDVLDMWIGNSEKNLHALFEQARRDAALRALLRRGGRPGGQPHATCASSGGRHLDQPVPGRARRRGALQRGRADPGGDERPLAPRPRLPPPGPLRPHPLRPAAGRRRPGRHPAPAVPGQARRATSTSRPWPGSTEGFSGADLKAVVDVAVEGKLREALQPRPPARRRPGQPCPGRSPAAPGHPRPAGRPGHRAPLHQGVVRHRPQLRPLRQPGRGLRRRPGLPQAQR